MNGTDLEKAYSWAPPPSSPKTPPCDPCARCGIGFSIQINGSVNSFFDSLQLYPCDKAARRFDFNNSDWLRITIDKDNPGDLWIEIGPESATTEAILTVKIILERVPGIEVSLIGSSVQVLDERFEVLKQGTISYF